MKALTGSYEQFVERSIDRVRGRDDEQSVTVGLRFCRGFSADDASRPAAVVRDDLFAEPFGQFGGDESSHDVVAPARRKRNDEAHRLGRIALCRGHPGAQHNRTYEHHREKTFHFVLHFAFLLALCSPETFQTFKQFNRFAPFNHSTQFQTF